MKCALPLLLLTGLVWNSLLATGSDKQASGGKIRVLLTYGGHGFAQEPFFALFDALPDVVYTKAPLPEAADRLRPGLEKEFDVIVMYDMVRGISAEQQKSFVELLNIGIGVVSLHHNLAAHREWDEFRKIIGGKFILEDCLIDGKRYPKSAAIHGQTLNIHVADKEHPITRGLTDFQIEDEVYGPFYTSPEIHVLLTTDHPQNNPEVAWTHQYGKSRVFYFMLGHGPKAWSHPNYSLILARGIRWAAGRL